MPLPVRFTAGCVDATEWQCMHSCMVNTWRQAASISSGISHQGQFTASYKRDSFTMMLMDMFSFKAFASMQWVWFKKQAASLTLTTSSNILLSSQVACRHFKQLVFLDLSGGDLRKITDCKARSPVSIDDLCPPTNLMSSPLVACSIGCHSEPLKEFFRIIAFICGRGSFTTMYSFLSLFPLVVISVNSWMMHGSIQTLKLWENSVLGDAGPRHKVIETPAIEREGKPRGKIHVIFYLLNMFISFKIQPV